MHAYGGAKADMEKALASIGPEGWLPMAAAMLGTEGKPPMWASVGLRPVVGTTIDQGTTHSTFRQRKATIAILLAASRSARFRPFSLLVGVDVEQGPDGIDSATFLKQNFDVIEAVQLYEEAQLGPLEELFDVNSPYPEGINQLALRISTYEYPLGALLAIYFLSVTGHMTPKFPLDKAVDEWVDAQKLLTPLENMSLEHSVSWETEYRGNARHQ